MIVRATSLQEEPDFLFRNAKRKVQGRTSDVAGKTSLVHRRFLRLAKQPTEA